MQWNTDQARIEFAWLRLMAQMKYDGYQDFLAGARFVESLADWLQQFPSAQERAAAYAFVRKTLVYFSTAEMNHLVELFYPEDVVWRLQQTVARRECIPAWQVWAKKSSRSLFERLRRQSLFIELSDGARIDVFRRANAAISNEQAVTAPRFNKEKWDELLDDLRKDLKDPDARFAFVFLMDDFVGSGTTLLRKKREGGTWTGKLFRFWEDVEGIAATHFEPDWSLCVHHYLATHRARNAVQERNTEISKEQGEARWFKNVEFSFGATLPADLPITPESHPDFWALTQQYYDKDIETRHTRVAGTDVKLGFGQCALPLILEHNTPNNSVALLWADTHGNEGRHAMRPLFRRRQRHVEGRT
jgi:hypothetical protein